MSRKVIGLAVVGFWVLGLGLLYKRNGTTSPGQSLTEAGMRVSPETYYYIVQQAGMQVGAASSSVDTTKQRIVAVDFVRGAIPVGKEVLKMEARSEARFTRGLRLRDFVMRADGDLAPFTIRGVMQEGEDKTLRITSLTDHGKPITQEALPEHPVFVPTMVGLPLMLRGEPKIGDSMAIAVFNPLSRTVNAVTIRVQADSLFLLADSAALDSTNGHWVKAHQNSVRGWRIGTEGGQLAVWVDASGRLIASSEPGGISLIRSTFEQSFANWKIDHPPPIDSARTRAIRPPDSSPGPGRR